MSEIRESIVLVAGGGHIIQGDEVLGLNEASEKRALVPAAMYRGDYSYHDPAVTQRANLFLKKESLVYFAGGYARLPEGWSDFEVSKREAPLMRSLATANGLPFDMTEIEPDSTSAIENSVYFIRNITGKRNPDERDISKHINTDNRVGIVASEMLGRRIARSLRTLGCMRSAICIFPTDEQPRPYDRIAAGAHAVGTLLTPRANTDALLAAGTRLEYTHDTVHKVGSGLIEFIKPATTTQTKVLS